MFFFDQLKLTLTNFSKRQITKELTDLLNHDRSPLGSSRPAPILEPSMQRHLTHFSLITHGFGSPAIVAVLNSFQNYLTEQLKYYEKSFSSNSSSSSSNSSSCGNMNGGSGGGSGSGSSSSSSSGSLNISNMNVNGNNAFVSDHANINVLNGMCMNNLLSGGLLNPNSMASIQQQQQHHQHSNYHSNSSNSSSNNNNHHHHSMHNEQLTLSPKISDNNSSKKDDVLEKAR